MLFFLDPSFVKSHLHHSIQNNDDILLFFDMIFFVESGPSPFTARLSRSPDLKLTNSIKPLVIPERKYGCGVLIGSANELICFCHKSSPDLLVYIWNPSLSAFLTLPPSSLPADRFHGGFGFDPKTDDYKVLKLTTLSRTSYKVLHGEVYSMRKGSWTLISPQTFPSHITIPEVHNSQVCVDDHLHWLSDTHLESSSRNHKLYWDLIWVKRHSLRYIFQKPYLIWVKRHSLRYLFQKPYLILKCKALGGKLCVMSCVDGDKCEVWVMDEYGVPKSWAKHHVFSQFSGDIVPCGFTSKCEFLFQVDKDDNRFGLYDPVAAKTKPFKIMSRNSIIMKFVEYVDSLVWVAPLKCEISSCGISQLQIA